MAHGPSGLGSPTSENENTGQYGGGAVLTIYVCVCIH